MNTLLSKSSPVAVGVLAFAWLGISIAYAEPHEHYHANHWVSDGHLHHEHYYPRVGYTVHTLPAGYVVVKYRDGPFYYHAGVWYRPSGPAFVVVTPPIGVVVPVLPPAYATIYSGDVPYYYANDVYYQQVPGGYAVINQPSTYIEAPQAPVEAPQAPVAQAPPAMPPPGSAPAAPGTWYYCDSAKAYYPYVSECREGWRAVPAAPPTRR